MVKLIIAGSRHINLTKEYIHAQLPNHQRVTRVISGGARGVDLAGEAWAEWQGLPYVRFVPGWGLHGQRYAAYVRNHDMGYYADCLLAIWDGKSRGTRHMIETMKDLGKPYKVVIYQTPSN